MKENNETKVFEMECNSKINNTKVKTKNIIGVIFSGLVIALMAMPFIIQTATVSLYTIHGYI